VSGRRVEGEGKSTFAGGVTEGLNGVFGLINKFHLIKVSIILNKSACFLSGFSFIYMCDLLLRDGVFYRV
jgi:hypothetical protein